MTTAFLGLGNMGGGMAGRLLAAGEALVVWNRTAAKAEKLRAAGATVAATPQEAVAAADMVITSLMDDASVSALFGEGGAALAAMRPGAVHLCVTTISPGCADMLQAVHAAHGTAFVSGPVLGRPDAAAAGELFQMLAGDAAAVARVEPLCRAFAPRQVHIPGSAGAANRQKLCMNLVAVAMIEAMAESLTFSEAIGASRDITGQFLQSIFTFPALRQYASRLMARDTDGTGGFAMSAGAKDVGLMLAEAARAGCPLDLGEVIAGKMRDALAQGMAGMDWSAIQEISRQRAGLGRPGARPLDPAKDSRP